MTARLFFSLFITTFVLHLQLLLRAVSVKYDKKEWITRTKPKNPHHITTVEMRTRNYNLRGEEFIGCAFDPGPGAPRDVWIKRKRKPFRWEKSGDSDSSPAIKMSHRKGIKICGVKV